MKVTMIFLFVFFNCFQFGIDENFSNNIIDIIKNSEITFLDKTGGILWDKKEIPPNVVKFRAVCTNGSIKLEYIDQWNNGKSEVYKRKRGALNKYLEIWRKMFDYKFYNLTDRDVDSFPSSDPLSILEVYEELRLEESRYEFFFKIKDYEHKYEVYDPEALKDKRYIQIFNDINDFFGKVISIE